MMRALSEDQALANAIALEGMGSGTIEHMAPPTSLLEQKVAWSVKKEKRKDKPI
jgi:hypothetical protein